MARSFMELVEIVGGVASVAKAGKEWFDQFGFIADDVTVTVYGTPASKKADLYLVAASLAFSMAQRLGPETALPFHPAPGSITVQYDAAQKYVTFNVKYNNSLAVILAAAALLPGKPKASVLSRTMPVFGAVKDHFTGDKFSFVGPGIRTPPRPGDPAPADNLLVPDLSRWEGHVILTDRSRSTPPVPGDDGKDGVNNQPTMNPRPWTDNRSRASYADLVFAALSTPGTDFDLLYAEPVGGPADGRTNIKDFSGV